MSILPPKTIDSPNLSIAWGKALLHAYGCTKRSLAPLVVSVSGFDSELPQENSELRSDLDAALSASGKCDTRTSALTIVPYEMWHRRGRPNVAEFSKLCVERFAPRMKRRNAANQKGIYFERMMAFVGEKKRSIETVDQLGFVINLLKKPSGKWPRQSALTISCFDPVKDHTGQPVRGFPCLQQVNISHDYDRNIAVNALYPTQYIFDRAYGNYLGLCQLGVIIAHETGLKFSRLNCFIGRPELGGTTKSAVKDLVASAERVIAEYE